MGSSVILACVRGARVQDLTAVMSRVEASYYDCAAPVWWVVSCMSSLSE